MRRFGSGVNGDAQVRTYSWRARRLYIRPTRVRAAEVFAGTWSLH